MKRRPALRAAFVALACAAVVLFITLSGCATMSIEEKAYLGASVADMATTSYALDHGFHEMNPILRGGSNAEVMAKSLAMNAALYALQKWFSRNDPPEEQRMLWRIRLVIRVLPVGWNASQILRNNKQLFHP